MRRHDLAGQCQADTRALFLGCEKGYENLPCDVIGNTGSVVADLDDDVAAAIEPPAQLDGKLAKLARGSAESRIANYAELTELAAGTLYAKHLP